MKNNSRRVTFDLIIFYDQSSGEGSLQDCIKSYTRYVRSIENLYVEISSNEIVFVFAVEKVHIKVEAARIARQVPWLELSLFTPIPRKSCTLLNPS